MTISVNGVHIENDDIALEASRYPDASAPAEAARHSLTVRELLLQRARELGIEPVDKGRDAQDTLIDQLLEREVKTPEPTEEECRRHYETNAERYVTGGLIQARHILFAVTPGAPVARIRDRAERLLSELMADPSLFAERARSLSNCPSGQDSGKLGRFERGQMVPEFDKVVFSTRATGVLPALVQTRYGFHVVRIEKRTPGRKLNFDEIRPRIAAYLTAQVQARALAQYVRLLAGKADIRGIDLDAAHSPLLQ